MAGTDFVSTPRASDNIATLTSFSRAACVLKMQKCTQFVAAVSFMAQSRLLLRIGVTSIRMRCVGCGVEAEMASKPPAAHPPVGLSNSYPYYRLGFLLLVTV